MKLVLSTLVFTGAALIAAFVPVTATAGAVNISNPFGAFNLQTKSLQEMRWDSVIRQQYDFSCGSAAVATLLTYHYNLPTREEDVFQAMITAGDRAKIQQNGFSMLDMKRYLDSRGFRSDGFKMSLDKLMKIGMPGITLINTQGYQHFVVVKGLDQNHVLVADPAVGSVVVPRAHFETIWNGSILGARSYANIARENFNSDRDWRIRPQPPIAKGVSRAAIGPMLLNLPGRNELGK
ncbi:C39 family peptidase [Marinobacter sp. X15-166B]|uniref:C39 family peptidase n=1 Tax=Marinobacter sp. X15-166B TaxID=1897620 RepID=UPI00085BD6DC|nr:C39 family peptidase [Marinobacter sp. X15-166B]OEY65107.1 peptidase C39 [Marinobacter sp. X15-166B]